MPLYAIPSPFAKPTPPWRQRRGDRRRSAAAVDAMRRDAEERREHEARRVDLPLVTRPPVPWRRCELDDLPPRSPARPFARRAIAAGLVVVVLRARECIEVRVERGAVRAFWGGVSERGGKLTAGGVIRGVPGWHGVTRLRAEVDALGEARGRVAP